MSNDRNGSTDEAVLISRAAHVVGRTGLAMSGAAGGTFVAALLARAGTELFDSAGFIAAMVLGGMIGSYLGVDIPGLRPSPVDPAAVLPKPDPVEWLSAAGTFLAAIAALISVYAFVFDDMPQRAWNLAFGSWWLLGIAMQISAGLLGRLRLSA
jgi:hypothetical protein